MEDVGKKIRHNPNPIYFVKLNGPIRRKTETTVEILAGLLVNKAFASL